MRVESDRTIGGGIASQGASRLSVPENEPPGYVAAIMKAEDCDSGEAGSISCNLKDGDQVNNLMEIPCPPRAPHEYLSWIQPQRWDRWSESHWAPSTARAVSVMCPSQQGMRVAGSCLVLFDLAKAFLWLCFYACPALIQPYRLLRANAKQSSRLLTPPTRLQRHSQSAQRFPGTCLRQCQEISCKSDLCR